jgi:hypothetical protein
MTKPIAPTTFIKTQQPRNAVYSTNSNSKAEGGRSWKESCSGWYENGKEKEESGKEG